MKFEFDISNATETIPKDIISINLHTRSALKTLPEVGVKTVPLDDSPMRGRDDFGGFDTDLWLATKKEVTTVEERDAAHKDLISRWREIECI